MASTELHHTADRPSFEKPVSLLVVVAPYSKDIAEHARTNVALPGWEPERRNEH